MASMAPSLANLTGTRAQDGSKQVVVCRVGQDYICNWIGKDLLELKSNKRQVAVQRDDLFVASGRALFDVHNGCYNNKKAHPVGLGHLHDLAPGTKRFIALLYHMAHTRREFETVCAGVRALLAAHNATTDRTLRAIRGLPDFFMGGVALTVGWPHGMIGDTATSVLAGGTISIQNGPFAINAGDTCTWIWSFEQCFFEPTGQRKKLSRAEKVQLLSKLVGTNHTTPDIAHYYSLNHPDDADPRATWTAIGNAAGINEENTAAQFLQLLEATVPIHATVAQDIGAKRRKLHFDEQMRVINENSADNAGKKGAVPLLIPLPRNHTYMDKRRAFARCWSSARPGDKTDIIISYQGS